MPGSFCVRYSPRKVLRPREHEQKERSRSMATKVRARARQLRIGAWTVGEKMKRGVSRGNGRMVRIIGARRESDRKQRRLYGKDCRARNSTANLRFHLQIKIHAVRCDVRNSTRLLVPLPRRGRQNVLSSFPSLHAPPLLSLNFS